MRVMLKGIHTSRKRLSDGSVRVYYYAWKNGPRIKADPGSKEFAAEFAELCRQNKTPPSDTVAALITRYKQKELSKLAASTQRDYSRYIKLIEIEFGTMPIAAVHAGEIILGVGPCLPPAVARFRFG